MIIYTAYRISSDYTKIPRMEELHENFLPQISGHSAPSMARGVIVFYLYK